MTDNSPRRWHCHPILHSSGDTIALHSARVAAMCIDLAAFLRHPLHDSDLPDAALKHDNPEIIMGDWPGPLLDRYPFMRPVKWFLEWRIKRDMGLRWKLTRKEKHMLHLCDKLDQYEWGLRFGIVTYDVDRLRRIAAKIGAYGWLDARL
jgi:hypothetical protein